MAFSSTHVIGSLVLAAFVISTSSAFAQSPTKPPAGRFQPLPANPEPPEIIAEQQNAEQALKNVNQGRLSPQQRRQLLLNHPNPSIRAKAQEAQRFKLRPMGNLDRPDPLAVLPVFWSLLNPFSASDVYAQSPFSVTLTPQARYSANPRASLSLHGCSAESGTAGFTAFTCRNTSVQAVGHVIAKPYIAVSVSIPRVGWYLLDFYGYGKPKATLEKLMPLLTLQALFSRQTLESWDTTASPTFLNHFATAEYLTQGNHTFYLSIDSSSLVFYEASIEEF